MGTINTAIQLSNIRSKIDNQQQIISMLEMELQKAILGDTNTTIAELFHGLDQELPKVNVQAIGGAAVANQQLYSNPDYPDDKFIVVNGETGMEFVKLEKLAIPLNADGSAMVEPDNWDVIMPEDWPRDASGNASEWQPYHPVTEQPTFDPSNAIEYKVAETDGAPAVALSVEDHKDEFSAFSLEKNSAYDGVVGVYGESNGYLAQAMLDGLGEFVKTDSDFGDTADQTVIRQMLYQARALLGELRVEEQHWNQEVNEEKARRKELSEFAKG